MISILTKFGLILLIIIAAAAVGFAQIDASNDGFRRRERDIDPPKSFTEMLAKQRLSKEKKDHEQMIARGDEAVEIAKQLEESFEKDNQVSRADLEKLKTLEEIVMKIRKELGGDDDDERAGVEALGQNVGDPAADDLHVAVMRLREPREEGRQPGGCRR